MKIRTEMIPELTVTRFARMRDVINFSPPYQREGGVWRRETRSLLIDTIINGLDVPKLYFEKATTRRFNSDGLTYQYAVIDGKQRLEAVSSFLDGELCLGQDFRFFEDKAVNARGMTLRDLQTSYPGLARRFLDYILPIVSVSADSDDLIEEMFQRLNASSALNAAEKRNAIAGPTREAANALAEHPLLITSSPIKNARYKYRELGAKFLAIEHQFATKSRIVDTKARTLEELFKATRGEPARISPADMESYRERAEQTLSKMAETFDENDPLLASIGTAVVYYLVFRGNAELSIDRTELAGFEELRRTASQLSEDDSEYARPANARLREYSRLVQSTNDGGALERRAEILSAYLAGCGAANPLARLDSLTDDEPADDEESDEMSDSGEPTD
ncbi:DUF262 domain-containing protein [Mycobacteroides abscessus]|uniref:DUF262 domain-containing protein n=1 Tax=Mycobacteroides abscessus TaxID=36809 RepID=UPI0009A71C95|nr:DUF262 domain-containing protein [Mycobacteroides abscessus]MDO3068263.1 DUF262 domain-containing protein [Mycobacteroides abscessus subsp. bolletii]SKN55836.1 Protein of uncharacterised function DUF262 [Mycobacteroides abscessus subsp. bolletii]SKX25583.1 Protein of uncharacterised function DUF262 [Mycobacteroides abscessus subsp. bolletii]